uniref:Uncharacterized protein, isoform A n=1 Tax=Drosophila melanogaster TaxID=7227 RepID=Q9VDY3_DROME|nr:uncharacterized protein Dmel_CG14280, isoform B [Drosophila melanogaster]NP_650797.1 uncharacterized protein Dmel_CG14280, isoform A [Drosophila melanogaster]AAF55656.1 uncharacterized protein Dmel_CG14280, isoform A [Drosophila melanogaster]AHN57404.1 uncharacterized protein Dmel_CG14280, isoform B [Drosophila melanogaster]|eukprot:NP_001287405.1 uncharacterized protein Dmel_CG14280, isoform B [Drosophila melanogaster]
MLSKRSDALISAFVLTLYYVGVADGNEASDFVTMGDLRRSRRIQTHFSRPGGMIMEGIGFQYSMRYQPGFHLHKLAQQQADDGGMGGMENPPETEAPMPMPTPGTPPPEPAPTEPEEPEPTIPMRPTTIPVEEPSPQPPTMMVPTPSASPGMQPSSKPRPTGKPSMSPPVPTIPSSTKSSIMQPHQTLKNILFGSPIKANLILKKPNAPRSKGKGFLSLFEVIKFPNTKCSVSMGDIRSMEGVCYHEFECKSLGGIPTESCAEGVGVCCVFVNGCGDVTSQQILYFESPNYPNAVREMMICVLIINVKKGVQQLRLDFQMFELSRPSNGDCVDDQFIVSGHNTNFQIPILCGINTGQHIYIHVGDSNEGKVYLSVFMKVSGGGRSFNIKVTQVDDNLAPNNCLQYFHDAEGVIKSFNYDTDGSIVDNREATYFNNLNYAICLARLKNVCSVAYNTEQLGGDQPDFQIINKDEAENDLISDGQAGAGIFNCPDDFIAINSVPLCGERFNDGRESDDYTIHATVRDTAAGPIILPFRTDSEYVGRGFRLLYKQELCA